MFELWCFLFGAGVSFLGQAICDSTLNFSFFLLNYSLLDWAFKICYLGSIRREMTFIVNFKTPFSKQIPFRPEWLAPGQWLLTPSVDSQLKDSPPARDSLEMKAAFWGSSFWTSGWEQLLLFPLNLKEHGLWNQTELNFTVCELFTGCEQLI